MYKDRVLIDELDDFLKLRGFIREETIWQYHNGEKMWVTLFIFILEKLLLMMR